MDLADLYVETGLVKTKSEFRRSVAQGAVRLNDKTRVEDPFAQLYFVAEQWVLVEYEKDEAQKRVTVWRRRAA